MTHVHLTNNGNAPMTDIIKLLALIFSTDFSAGLLVTSIVFVPGWRDVDTSKAFIWFSNHTLTLGYLMLPMGVLTLLLCNPSRRLRQTALFC